MNDDFLSNNEPVVKMVKNPADANLKVRFYRRCKENGQGVPYGDPLVWVEISERNSGTRPPETVDRLAGPQDAERFPYAYALFMAEGTGKVPNIIGTKISEVAELDAHALRVIGKFGIEYAEQLAAADYKLLSSFGPYGHVWQKAAQEALRGNPAERIAKAQADAKKDIEILKKKLAELQDFTLDDEAESGEQPKKRGRPAKVINGNDTTDN